MRKKSEYVIAFSSLAEGHHFFKFEIGNKFFEQLDYSEIQKAEIIADVDFEKKETMMIVNLSIKGQVEVMCDKCTDDFSVDIQGQDEIFYKFSDVDEYSEKVKCVSSKEVDIDLSHPIYEFICLILPQRRIHQEGECNPVMLNEMDNYLMVEKNSIDIDKEDQKDENELDPRWEALKKLKKK